MERKRETLEASTVMQRFEIKIERPKPNPLDELIDLLKKILDYCLCCVTCGCYPGRYRSRSSSFNHSEYRAVLLENEQQAVQNLLTYLEHEETKDPVLNEEHVRALSILSDSDNEDLQRSAALCYTEISEKMKSPVTPDLVQPLVELLKSHDQQVQKAATLAISNFALYGHEDNKDILVQSGSLPPLVHLLRSPVVEIQCNTCGCITTLATQDSYKHLIVTENGIAPLLQLVQSSDLRVQRNAAGAILNLTHLQSNRNALVANGAIPELVEVLKSTDTDVQYYCTAALSNIAVNEKHRAMMVALGSHDIIAHLIRLIASKSERVRCQACFALRNLASDVDNQRLSVRYGALPVLHRAITASHRDTRAAAMACLRNLSIHKANERPILSEDMICDICNVLGDSGNPEAQRHAAGIIRNLSVGEHIKALVDQNCVEHLVSAVLDLEIKMEALAEVTAALAVMADEDDVKYKLVEMHDGKLFYKLVTLASLSSHPEVQYNSAGTLGQLALIAIPTTIKKSNMQGMVLYIDKFLKSQDPSFIHIALWTLVQLLKDELFLEAFRDQGIEHVIQKFADPSQTTMIQELSETALHRLKGDSDTSTSSSD